MYTCFFTYEFDSRQFNFSKDSNLVILNTRSISLYIISTNRFKAKEKQQQ